MSLQLTDRIKGKPELSRLCETDDGFVALYWRETPGAQQFIIEKLNRETGLFDKIARVPENVFSYIDTDVEAAQVYAYRITAQLGKHAVFSRGLEGGALCADIDAVPTIPRSGWPCWAGSATTEPTATASAAARRACPCRCRWPIWRGRR